MSEPSGCLQLEGQVFELDENGYLRDASCWQPCFAEYMAAQHGMELGETHWQLIRFARDWFQRYADPPAMRPLVRELGRLTSDEVGSRELYRMFPEGPARIISLLAGLPKPLSCI